jgi:hypothetical protein
MICSRAYNVELQPRTVHQDPKGENRYCFSLPLTSALDGGEWSTPSPGHFTPGEYPVSNVQEAGWCPLYRRLGGVTMYMRLGGPQGQAGRVRQISP